MAAWGIALSRWNNPFGVGIRPPTPSWGGMLSDAVVYYTQPHFMFWPGMAIFVTVLAFNLFGDGLRDALDPRANR